MANAQVEKLKALGLRHGEKAVVGLASALCLLLLVSAVRKPSIELTPDEIASHWKAAEANINRPQNNEDILKRLEEEGLKDQAYEKLVDAQKSSALVADNFKPVRPWVTPEPGAGLIRDKPELIAPTDLYAYPGRGGAIVFALDESGKRIAEDPDKKADDATKQRRTRRRRKRRSSAMGSMAGGPSMMNMMRGGMGGSMGGPESDQDKKARERAEKAKKKLLVGDVGEETEKKKDTEEGAESETYKEVTKGLRWVVITGVLDHKTLRENYLTALKNSAVAHPNYKQLEAERQTRQPDGSWSEWEAVDEQKNREISFNLPEEEEELTPDEVRIDALVDPLPFLKAGYWERVHVVSLVPKEKRETPKAGAAGAVGGSMMGGSMRPGGMASGRGSRAGMLSGTGGGGMGGGMGAAGAMRPGGMMGGGGGGASTAEDTDFDKSDADKLMLRLLDYTVEPDATYRFRLRIVVFNPNYSREDVSPGVDTKAEVLKGPWSEPTDEVTMPADVTSYAIRKAPASAKSNDSVTFQVVRWNPENGVTVTRNFDAGPGEVIGEPGNTRIPNTDGGQPKNQSIDYNSHELVLDVSGGPRPVHQIGVGGAPLDVPSLSLLLKPDGTVIARNEAYDRPDPVRKDMAENYQRELKESGKQRQNSMGSMYGGMMGGAAPAR